ncbi:PCMD domain-containing protein [Bacteroides clarus]|uniref:PCMD domain-containing protein n=1 Tax=Bacteroides clarus TaxID=626929 RepID=UPI0026653758|nr:PCMD domain-containing protein [Bacteroides clarus]
MNFKKWTTALMLALAVSSCIQDEALNSEAAIDACTGADVQLAHINSDSKEINIYVHKGANLSKQQLSFTLPAGATLSADQHYPDDIMNTYDFSNESRSRTFTVTSEDGEWHSTYTVKIIPTEVPGSFHFEELLPSNNTEYDILYEFEPGTSTSVSRVLQWSSGNPGFKLTSMADGRTGYPTQQITDGYCGKGLKLTTCDTGSFGAMVKMYIAAGNLFIGSFDLANALKDPLRATKFGIQYYKRPVSLKGYYKFKAGEVYTDEGVVQKDKKDRFDIYAILYEADDNTFMLDGGNSLDLTSGKLVSIARIKEADAKETDTWTAFDLPFEAVNGKSIDTGKLQNGKYKLSIVLSSSVDGAYFKGAVGSTLYVDELELISQDN